MPFKQLPGLHARLSKDTPCPNDEFLRRLAYAVWHIPAERQAYLQHMAGDGVSPPATLPDFRNWLCTQTGGWVNLTHLVVWGWDRITIRQSTPLQTLPLQSTSHHARPNAPVRLLEAAPATGANTAIAQWCARHGLNQAHQEILNKLGFTIGDDLKDLLTDDDWQATGALPLEKRRLIGASEKDREERHMSSNR
jgi:hypothetical protein